MNHQPSPWEIPSRNFAEPQDHPLPTEPTSSMVSQFAQETLAAAQQTGPAPKVTINVRPLMIAIANYKGGVAKTTSVVSLAGALVKHGQEVLVIDLDAQANLTLALGKDPQRLRGSIADVFFNSASLLSVSRETDIPGLDLVPSNSTMEVAERFLPMRQDYELLLRRILHSELRPAAESALRELRPPVIQYDFVIMDCPPFLGAVTLNALSAADLLIIPTQPEFFSAYALRGMTQTIQQVRSRFNPDLLYRILITMFDRRNRIHRHIAEQIHQAFGEGVFKTVIPIDTKLRESAVEGVPISHHKSQSRSALQYDALAQELISYVQ